MIGKAKPHWTRNIRRWYRRGRRSDTRWYGEARAWCKATAKIVGTDWHLVAAVLAILSPGTSWERNKFETRALLRGWPVMFTTYPANVRKARKAVREFKRHEDVTRLPEAVAPHWPRSGHKILSFFDNIVRPDESPAVTIDRHAVAVCLGRTPTERELSLSWKAYRDYSRAYEIVAREHNVRPHEVQAVTWCEWRRTEGDLHAAEALPF